MPPPPKPCPVTAKRLEEIYYASNSLAETAQQIAQIAGERTGSNRVVRWMDEFAIPRRTMSACAQRRIERPEGKKHIATLAKARKGSKTGIVPAHVGTPENRKLLTAGLRKAMAARRKHFTCPICNTAFMLTLGQIESRRKNKEKAEEGLPLVFCCSRPCAAKKRKELIKAQAETILWEQTAPKSGFVENWISVPCEYCHKPVTRPVSRFTNPHVYCNTACSNKGRAVLKKQAGEAK